MTGGNLHAECDSRQGYGLLQQWQKGHFLRFAAPYRPHSGEIIISATHLRGCIALQILDKVKSIVGKQLGVEEDKVKEDSKFVDDLGADSLDAVEMVMALEDEFGVEIGEESAEKLASVQAGPF